MGLAQTWQAECCTCYPSTRKVKAGGFCGKFQTSLSYRVKKRPKENKTNNNNKKPQGWPYHSVGRAHPAAEALSSIPAPQKPDVVAHSCRPSGGKQRQKEQRCKVILGCNQLEASPGYTRPSQKRICKYLCDSPSCSPPCSLQQPLAPHRGQRVNCTVRPGAISKAEEVPSKARLCSQAIPASPLSSPTST